MNTLRWILGLVIVLLSGGFVVLSIVAGGFRKSFGASGLNPLLIALPLMAMALLLGGLIWPASRPLLHAGAIAAVVLIGFCIWQMVAESATVLAFGLIYLVAWLVFYGLAAWKVA